MKKLSANFYPAKEEKNGYLGKADITIAEAIRLNGISVFRNKDDSIGIRFPEYPLPNGDKLSYVTPKSPEAYAALCSVVANAIESEKHFGFITGTYLKNQPGERIEVHGKAVQEPYADARFNVDIADVVSLHGIRTYRQSFEKNGRTGQFTAVKMPVINTWETPEGEKRYQTAFEGRFRASTDRDGKEFTVDYADLLNGLILAERKMVLNLDRKPGLDDKVKAAEAQKSTPAPEQQQPEREPARV